MRRRITQNLLLQPPFLKYTNLKCNALSITYQKGDSRGQTDEA